MNKLRLFIVIISIILASSCSNQEKTIEVWGAFDYTESVEEVLHTKYKNTKFTRFIWEEYKDILLNQFNLEKGPDIAIIPVDWLEEMKPYIKLLKGNSIEFFSSAQKLQADPDYMYGLPADFDSLVMYWNPMVLSKPPKTWEQIIEYIHIYNSENKRFINIGPETQRGDIQKTLIRKQMCAIITAGEHEQNCSQNRADDFFYSFGIGRENEAWGKEKEIEAFTSGDIPLFLGFYYQKKALDKINPVILPVPKWRKQSYDVAVSDYWVIIVNKNSYEETDEIASWLAREGNKEYTEKNNRLSGYAENDIVEPWATARILAR